MKQCLYEPDRLHEKLFDVIKEVFMLRIASVLGTGPQMQEIFPCDLMIFSNVIEYSMECCLTEENMFRNIRGKLMEDLLGNFEKWLWECLRRNHIFGIMHLDIKNENIGFS